MININQYQIIKIKLLFITSIIISIY